MMSCQENCTKARASSAGLHLIQQPAEKSYYPASLCVSGPLGRADGETVVQQDHRPADRLRPGHYQSEGRWAGEGETNICAFEVAAATLQRIF